MTKDSRDTKKDSKELISGVKSVAVHPTVLLSIADHHHRVAGKLGRTDRVIGMLMGDIFHGTANATSSFPVPFEEDQHDPSIWFVDTNYIEDMYALHRKVSLKESLVGWYSSSSKIRVNDLEIHELLRRFVPSGNLVFITADIQANSPHELPTAGFLSTERLRFDGEKAARVFESLPTTVNFSDVEEVGVGHLLRHIRDEDVSEIGETLSNSTHALAGLADRLDNIASYLDDAADGRIQTDPHVVALCERVFGMLPNLQLEDTQRALTATGDEATFLVLVGQLSTAITSLHDLVNRAFPAEKKKDKKEKDAKL